MPARSQKRGKRIPQDVSVISRAEDRSVDAFVPTVSHYHLPIEKVAPQIARAARQWMEHPNLSPRTIRLMPELVKGETV